MSTSEYWQRFSKQRLSRRKMPAAGAGAAGVAGFALVGCGGGEKENGTNGGTPGGDGSPKRGGVFQQGTTIGALSIDPHTDVTMGLAFVPFIYGYLLHQVEMFEGAPLLMYDNATSHEQPDDLTYVFNMRKGVHFQNLPPVNGREVVAEDVVYSFNRITSVAPQPFWKNYVKTMSAPDPYTFRLDIAKPYAYTLPDVGGAIVPKEAVEQWGDLKTHGLGSGPFQVKNIARGASMEMERNPDYYAEGIPYLDGINWRIIPDDSSLRASFRARQLDTYAAPTKIQADDVRSFGNDVVSTREPELTISMVNLNEIKVPELQDVRVREALDIALDRDAMIDKLCFGEGNYCGPVSWGLGFWSLPQDELRQRFKRDLTKAKQLLEAANAGDLTLDLKFLSGPLADLCAVVKDQLEEIGITVKLVPMELGTFVSALSGQDFQLMIGASLPYSSEKLPMQFNHTYNFTRDQNPVRQPEPEIDSLLDQIFATPDVNERQKLVLETTRKILDRHGPFLYLFAPYRYTARWSYVRGYEDVPTQQKPFVYNMWLDK